MITVPTHKCHKSSFKHSKTIHVFASGPLIITVQIHSRKKLLKGLKWPLQNRPQYRSRAGVTLSCYKIKWKGCLQVWGGDALRMLHVSIMFWSCPQKLGDFYCGSTVGQVHPTKGNWSPHWDHGKNRKAHLNIISQDKIRVPKSKSINFGA
jgi:hypothetical protein